MFNQVKNFTIRLGDVNFRILWLELLVFSVILGASLHSWPVACLMLLGLSWILNRHKGQFYMIFILSFVWGLVAMTIGYCFGGLGWAVASGLLFFMFGVSIHFRDLKGPLYEVEPVQDSNAMEWGQSCRWHQNLN